MQLERPNFIAAACLGAGAGLGLTAIGAEVALLLRNNAPPAVTRTVTDDSYLFPSTTYTVAPPPEASDGTERTLTALRNANGIASVMLVVLGARALHSQRNTLPDVNLPRTSPY